MKRGYSALIRPIIYTIDSCLLILIIEYVFLWNKPNNFTGLLLVGWFLISFFTGFYIVFRHTKPIKIAIKSIKQFLVFTLLFFACYSFTHKDLDVSLASKSLLMLFVTISIFKLLIFWMLKRYRKKGGNKRNIIIIGHNKSTRALEDFFIKNPFYGYTYIGFFTNKNKNGRLGDFEACFEYLKDKTFIDEIYCSINELRSDQIERLVKFSNTHFKTLKFIPDSSTILSSNFEVQYYDYFPVLEMSKIALNNKTNRMLKRVFDVVISLIMVLGVLSWLAPILFILMKLDSKGPLLFAMDRNGLDYKKFKCYKFRTLRINTNHEQHVEYDDDRVTRFGRILRKTSIDELPQFINVLKGEMSVVGPRPHMLSFNRAYADQVDNLKLMARHLILPGITGLAQVKGFRGEVETDNDIIGRVKLDLFYIQNWTILLDLKIIFLTIYNIFKGDKKAY